MLKGLKKRREEKIKKRIREEEKEIQKIKESETEKKIEEILDYFKNLSNGFLIEIAPIDSKINYLDVSRDSLSGEVFEADNLRIEGDDFSLRYVLKKDDDDEVLFILNGEYESNFGKIRLFYLTDPKYGYVDRNKFEEFFPGKEEVDELLEKIESKTSGKLSETIGKMEVKPVLQKVLHSDGKKWTSFGYGTEGPINYSCTEENGEILEEKY